MSWLPSSPPNARMIYLWAFLIAFLVGIITAITSGAFEQETHPDPTLGSLGGLLAVFFGISSFIFLAGLLVIGRWVFWPSARTTLWHVHAAIYTAGVLYFVGLFLFANYFVENKHQTDKNEWAVVENTPLVEGMQEAYFPKKSQRFERHKPSELPSYREYAIEATTAYEHTGFFGYYGQVSKRTFATEQEANQALLLKIQQAKVDGYQPVKINPIN